MFALAQQEDALPPEVRSQLKMMNETLDTLGISKERRRKRCSEDPTAPRLLDDGRARAADTGWEPITVE